MRAASTFFPKIDIVIMTAGPFCANGKYDVGNGCYCLHYVVFFFWRILADIGLGFPFLESPVAVHFFLDIADGKAAVQL